MYVFHQAEHVADRSLAAARDAVVQAREHVRRLELEADEECVSFWATEIPPSPSDYWSITEPAWPN